MAGRIANAIELARRIIPIPSNLCLMCGLPLEMADHLLATCFISKGIWWQVQVWLKIPVVSQFDSAKELINLVEGWERRKVVQAIFMLTCWRLWKNKNDKVFKGLNVSCFKMVHV
ncbi:hypothetical protein Hanom_Chr09g00804311 [Helianthus anomalus]